VAALAGLSLPINACRVQVAVFRQPPEAPPRPFVLDFVHATYIRPEIGNLTIGGLIDPAEANNVVDPDAYAQHVDDDFIPHLAERLLRRFPAMERSESRGGYAGLYAVTPDWHPLIDECPPGSCCYICSGFSGHGFKLGPAVGVMVADLVTGATDPAFSPDLFRFSRFAEQALVRGTYDYSIAG
jgi:glycine/D-amino acid oxidase-like deaminating enzyme